MRDAQQMARRACHRLNANQQGSYMTKIEAEHDFREILLPHVPPNDKPALRQAWNDHVDGLQKRGEITAEQAARWGHPRFID